jgi:hypothetical protein
MNQGIHLKLPARALILAALFSLLGASPPTRAASSTPYIPGKIADTNASML